MVTLSIVIPVYNEKGNIVKLVESISNVFKAVEYEVIFVDDNSPDGTATIVKELEGFGKNIRLVERAGKFGLSSAVATGVKAASAEIVIIMDGDLSHPPETAYEMFKSSEGYDLVIASRKAEGSGDHDFAFHRDIISKAAESLSRPFVGKRTTDPMSGFFLVKKSIFEKTKIRVKGYKILLNIIHDNPNLKILEIPYTFQARYSGKTKLTFSEIVNYVFDLGRLAWK